MRALVVGGAGYIGSHTVRALARAGWEVVVLDNLSTGHRAAVPEGTPFVRGDILNGEDLERALATEGAAATEDTEDTEDTEEGEKGAPRSGATWAPDAGRRRFVSPFSVSSVTSVVPAFDVVFHFAAKAAVGESVADPELYYRENVAGSLALFSAAMAAGAGGVVFSSSAATYGVPESVPIPEDAPLAPVNPYGWTKRMMEQILADFASAYGFPSVSLRYFNAAGAEPRQVAQASSLCDRETSTGKMPVLPWPPIGEDHSPETHLIPNVLFAARDGGEVPIFGADYDTPDGTAVRDYVHVTDLAEAHVLAARGLERGRAKAFNLGNGAGYSVREVIDTARRVTGREIRAREAPRRAGDPPRLVASADKFRREFGWEPKFAALPEIVRTAWEWHVSHPKGYGA
jgi:UDP-glucose-4-epimerase GalE